MKRLSFFAYILVSCLYGSLIVSAPQQTSSPAALQDLWNASATWTREYLVDVCADLPNKKEAEKKLLSNQKALGETFEPHYGKEVAQKFVNLLKEQATITIDIISSAHLKDDKKFKELEGAWKRNACALSSFLSRTNPYIAFIGVRDMLYDYLSFMLAMIQDRVNKKWNEDIIDYDKARAQNALLAQMLAQAIEDAFAFKKKKKATVITPPTVPAPFRTPIGPKAL